MVAPNAPTLVTIKTSSDFQRIARQGKKWVGSAFIMQVLQKEPEIPFRFGLTASRKVGNAVVRNRAKRRLREVLRALLLNHTMNGTELVLIAKTSAADIDFTRLQADMVKGLRTLGVLA